MTPSNSWLNQLNIVTDADGLEFIPDCSRCERVRLVNCRRSKFPSESFCLLHFIWLFCCSHLTAKCYYRCSRTCRDINGTAYHETVKFSLPGNRWVDLRILPAHSRHVKGGMTNQLRSTSNCEINVAHATVNVLGNCSLPRVQSYPKSAALNRWQMKETFCVQRSSLLRNGGVSSYPNSCVYEWHH